jgi:hypothetical protein
MSALQKVANVAQKGAVLGLLGMLGYHSWQITSNMTQGRVQHETMDMNYFEEQQKVVEEEYKDKYGKTDKRDWYDKDDNSYLKNVPRGMKPKGAKEQQ